METTQHYFDREKIALVNNIRSAKRMSGFDELMYKECNFTVHLYTRKQVVVAIQLNFETR